VHFLSCPGSTGASSLDPPVKPGGDKKNGPWINTLRAWYHVLPAGVLGGHAELMSGPFYRPPRFWAST
jgi:hypothetical protein